MRKPIALLFAAALVLGMAGMANAQTNYTWTLIEGASAYLLWPNEANSPNKLDADGGLLGRIVPSAVSTVVSNTACTGPFSPFGCCTGVGTGTCDLGTTTFGLSTPNACELAPSYPCSANSPPTFLLPAGTAEGPPLSGGGDECNRNTFACGGPGSGQGTNGDYSYLVIHTAAQGTTIPASKGIGFFSGTFVRQQDGYVCNDCPPTGKGHEKNVGNVQCIDFHLALVNGVSTQRDCCEDLGIGKCDFLSYPTIGAVVKTLSTSLWLTQSTPPFGHAQVTLKAGGAGAGETSICGNGIVYQDLITDLCVDGLSAGGNFTIPNQKTVFHIYPVTLTGKCNRPDCYIQNVIIPAALAQDPLAKHVQVLVASSILPADAPGTLASASVDSILFMYTTRRIDFDEDGVADDLDPCPMDATDNCVFDPTTSLPCVPAGTVFCSDENGNLTCLPPYQCNVKGDLNNDCASDIADLNLMTGVADGIGGLEHWNTTLPIGPFDP